MNSNEDKTNNSESVNQEGKPEPKPPQEPSIPQEVSDLREANPCQDGSAAPQANPGLYIPPPSLPNPSHSELMLASLVNPETAILFEYDAYLDTLPFDNDSKNDRKSNWAGLRAATLRVDFQIAIKAVERKILAAGGTVDRRHLERQFRRAYEYIGKTVDGTVGPFEAKKADPFDPERLKGYASRVNIGDPATFLRLRSPVPTCSITRMDFLERLFSPGEHIVIFTDQKSQGQVVYRVGAKTPKCVPEFGTEGVWFLVQPVDGKFQFNPREGKKSRRSEESVTSWRHLLLESDKADPDNWIRLLIQLPLRIVAIYSSGGRSIHALVRVDAKDKADWDRIKARIAQWLVPLGACPGALSAVRLSRVPQCWRGDRLQELLYLDPNAEGQPILVCNPGKEVL